MTRFFKYFWHVVFGLVTLAGALWVGTALWLHLAGGLRIAALILLGTAALGAFGLRFFRSRRTGWAALIASGLVVGGWYQTLTPRQDRDWEADVSRGVKAQVEGDIVTLSDVRDFEWHSRTEASERWISQTHDLNTLDSLDMITSVWDSPDIAHLLVSFGFTTGEHVVFSIEIRRDKGEKFNELGGFFRQFELVLIGATESDIVKLRTNYRNEQVRLYPVHLTPEQLRTMFMSYVDMAQKLEGKPRYYNTVTANCTTSVWALAHSLKPDMPVDRRLILSGHLPDYLTDLGVVDAAPAEQRDADALITARAQSADGSLPYSQLIRSR
ncbi:MAG: DUF4105 domain-containing protein [Maritimibacter sp.]